MAQTSNPPEERLRGGTRAPDATGIAVGDIDRFYRDLVEEMSDLVQSVAPDGRILFVNRAWRETLGYTQTEVGTMNIFQVIDADSQAHCMGMMQRLMAGEDVGAIEFSLRARDGRLVHVEGRATLYADNGKPVATRGIYRDVTERRRSQQSLRESDERLRAIGDNLPDAAIYQLVRSASGELRFNFLSSGIRRLLDITPEQAAAEPRAVFERVHSDDRATYDAAWRMSAETLSVFDVEARIGEGPARWLHSRGHPTRLADGGIQWDGVISDITERKRIDEALRVATERLSLALSGSQLALWDWDLRTGKVYLSKEWAQIAELDQSQPLTVAASDLQSMVHPDDLDGMLRELRQVLKGERTRYSVEHRIKSGAGRWKWIHSHGMVAERGVGGQVVRMAGTNADIDVRKRAEEDLRAALLQEEAILTTSPVGIFVARERIITKANRMMEKLFGYDPGEMLGLPTRAICASEEQWRWVGDEGYRIMREGMLHAEIDYLRKDGSRFWGLLSGAQVDRDDADRGLLFTVTDISDQKNAQEVLAAAEQRLRDMTNGLPGAVYQFRWGADGRPRIIFISEGIGELIGIERKAIEADPSLAFQCIAEEDRARFFASLKSATATKARKWSNESRIRRPDGSVVWTRSEASRQGHGHDSVWNGYWVDISAQRDIEDKLNDARIAADAANRAKSAFLATMSHEIRTPMNAVLGMLELLGLSGVDASQREMLAVVDESAKSLLRIIDDILDVSKIEAGQMSIHAEPSALDSTLDSVVKSLAVGAHRKGLLLRQQIDVEMAPNLMFDAARLRQVLFNLIGNAIKFTEKGHVDLRATLLQDKAASQVVRIEVQDSGIGIGPEDQQRLFKPFVQAEEDTTRRFGGTGLGLVISRRLVELMGGTLDLTSELGRGTTMTAILELPKVEKAPLPAVSSAQASTPSTRSDGLRVLVAEDNEINRLLLGRQIETLGYQADFATDGEQAFKLWHSRRYAAVLCDCRMPVMDGYSFARAVRAAEAQEPSRKKVPILAYTANVMKEDAEACYAAGMDDVVAKPVTLATLRRTFAAWGLAAES
jgi:PAS domain S-box-containing protein